MLFREADVRVNRNKQKITSQQLHIDAMADSPLQGNSGRLVLGCIGANFGVAGCDTQFAFRPAPRSDFIFGVAECDTQFAFRPVPRSDFIFGVAGCDTQFAFRPAPRSDSIFGVSVKNYPGSQKCPGRQTSFYFRVKKIMQKK